MLALTVLLCAVVRPVRRLTRASCPASVIVPSAEVFDSLSPCVAEVVDAGLHIVHRGGIFFKPLANYQFDQLIGGSVVTQDYLEGCYRLGMHYPDLCASVYVVCERGTGRS